MGKKDMERKIDSPDRNHFVEKMVKFLSLNDHIIDSAGIGLLVFNATGNIIFLNDFAQEVIRAGLEISPVPPQDLLETHSIMGSGTPSLSLKSGQGRRYSWKLLPVKSFSSPPGWLIIIHDLTRHFDLEEKKNMMEKVMLSKELIAGGTHEIMNSLTTLGGFVELLMDLDDSSVKASYYEIMLNEINRCSDMLKEYLFLARSPEPKIRKVSVNEILEQIFTLAENNCRKHSVKIEWFVAAGIPALNLDPDQIKQVFLNLINNAVQAMPGGGLISIAASVKEDTVRVVFSDTGPGIPDEDLENIFEPFFTTKSDGTGLGLTLSARIVKNHHGRLTAKSDEKGSVFTVFLPTGCAAG